MALDGCPAKAGPDREAWFLQAIKDGRGQFELTKIDGAIATNSGRREASFFVFKDALKVDGVRINVNAATEQQIADLYGFSLLTPHLADLLWVCADIHINPCPRNIGDGSHMADTQWMIDHSAAIDKQLVGLSSGLVSTVGKHWCIDEVLASKTPGTALNYGWHFHGPNFNGITGEVNASLAKDSNGQYIRLIQGRGTAHNIQHTDYSQTTVLVSSICILDGKAANISDILTNAELAPLASCQGKMSVLRQPTVEKLDPMPELQGIINQTLADCNLQS